MLGLGLGISRLGGVLLPAWLRAYIKRVNESPTADVEARGCVKEDGDFLVKNTRAGIIIDALADYSVTQGGDGAVNRDCSTVAVDELLYDPKPQTRFLFLSQDKGLELEDYFCLNADVDALEGQFAVKGEVVHTYGQDISAGEITLSLYNGTAPYTFRWSNGATAQNISGLTKGEYWVQVTDANGNVANNRFTVLGDADPAIVTAGLRMDSYFTANSLDFPALGSAEFNGTSDYVQLPTPFSYTNHTIAAWVYANDITIANRIFDNRDGSDDGFSLLVFEDRLYYQLNNSDLNPSISLEKEWFFVTATYDGTTQKLYINGSLEQSTATSQTINTATNAIIGRQSYSSVNYMDGNLANLAIWNRALHPDEINAIMWKSYSELDAVQKNGLQAWYALDDITGTTVPDSTGNHNGTAN